MKRIQGGQQGRDYIVVKVFVFRYCSRCDRTNPRLLKRSPDHRSETYGHEAERIVI